MEYNINDYNGIKIINIKGDIDVSVSDVLKELVQNFITEGSCNILFDMADVNYLDSSGLGVFVVAFKLTKANNGAVKVANLTMNVREVFEITKIDSFINIYNTIDEAVQSF